ncbi:hypothetical protein DFJ74DRAFT_704380 [Hyaloraphidium curvatum]|nr:hypothetical protein DFJ74DRAFT_704380 [Hyaloraphidium curvatum]
MATATAAAQPSSVFLPHSFAGHYHGSHGNAVDDDSGTVPRNLPVSRPKPALAIDLDETLAATHEGIIRFFELVSGRRTQLSDYRSYNYCDVWQCSMEESIRIVRQFCESHHYEAVPPVAMSQESLADLANHFELYIVTSRPETSRALTERWLDTHFPGMFHDGTAHRVLYGNSFLTAEEKAAGLKQRSKSQLCRLIEAVALIDDSLDHARDVADHLPHVVLFDLRGEYRWNHLTERCRPLPPNVIRAHDWQSIKAFLMSKLA